MKNHSQILKFSNSQILFAILAWSLLILRFGYRFGTGDQVELLPYTLFLHDSSLYTHDFFIQGLNASIPNERTVMANLLLPFVNHLEIFCLIFQFLSTVILILGLEKLARRFIVNKYFAWLSVLIALIPLNDFTLGNVELYSECFQASGLAVAIVVWAINLFLDRKYLWTSVFMSAATFVQLLEGLDVMMVLCAILFICFLRKEVSFKSFLQFISVYAFTAGIYLIMIFMQKNVSSDISNQELFKILFEFRHPHHFIFSAFPKIKMLVFFILTLTAISFFSLRSKTLFQFALLGFAGVIIYAFGVDELKNIFIGNFQFYKITIWLKFIGVVGVVGLAEDFFKTKMYWFKSFKYETALLVIASVFCWLVIFYFHQQLPYTVPYQMFEMKGEDDAISICEKIKEVVPSNAVFIQPFENTELKFYAQRSSYIEFKANVRNRKFVKDWANRVQEVYGVTPDMKEKGFQLQQKADVFFYSLSKEQIELLKKKGVTHLLAARKIKPDFGNLVLSNKSYAVYQL